MHIGNSFHKGPEFQVCGKTSISRFSTNAINKYRSQLSISASALSWTTTLAPIFLSATHLPPFSIAYITGFCWPQGAFSTQIAQAGCDPRPQALDGIHRLWIWTWPSSIGLHTSIELLLSSSSSGLQSGFVASPILHGKINHLELQNSAVRIVFVNTFMLLFIELILLAANPIFHTTPDNFI